MWSLGKVLKTPEVMRVYIGCVSTLNVQVLSYGGLGRYCFVSAVKFFEFLFLECH